MSTALGSGEASIAIVCHDVGGNALGRAIVLAELLSPIGRVRIVGFGSRLWPPAEGFGEIEMIPSRGSTFTLTRAVRDLERAVRHDSHIVASKTRVLSFGTALAVRGRRRLIVDIDDLEHRFVRRRWGWLRQLAEVDREPATRLLERMTARADAITVASRALQRRFGGTWLPHVRDRGQFADLAARDGPAARHRLGLDGRFVVGFIGTPRPHKGLGTAAAAIGEMGGDATLLIVGAPSQAPSVHVLSERAKGRVLTVPAIPLADVPAVLGACDVILIPQEQSVEGEFQTPAKLFDALAAGAAIIASDVGDLREVMGDAGILVPPGDVRALLEALSRLRDPSRRLALGTAAVERHRAEYGLHRWQATATSVVLGSPSRSIGAART